MEFCLLYLGTLKYKYPICSKKNPNSRRGDSPPPPCPYVGMPLGLVMVGVLDPEELSQPDYCRALI